MKRICLKTTIVLLILSVSSCLAGKDNRIQTLKNSESPLLNSDSKEEKEESFDWKVIDVEILTDNDIIENRNLSLYEKENTSKCKTFDCVENLKRNFIWNHLNQKALGYIKNKWQDPDLLTIEHIFIESDKNGKWKVVWKQEQRMDLGNPPSNKYLREVTNIHTVEKKNLNKVYWHLIFRNSDGEIVKKL